MCVCVGRQTHSCNYASVEVKGQLEEIDSPFPVDLEGRTQFLRLHSEHLYLLSYLAHSVNIISKVMSI